jgi:hypothetical protein
MVSSFVMYLIKMQIKTKPSDGYNFLSFVSFHVKQKLYNSDDYGISYFVVSLVFFSICLLTSDVTILPLRQES